MPKHPEPQDKYDPILAEAVRGAASAAVPGASSVVVPFARPAEPASKAAAPASKSQGEPVKATKPAGRLSFKHFKVTEDEDFEIADFIRGLQQKSRSKVTFSVVSRALFQLAMHARDEIIAELAKGDTVPRPANDDPESLADFEEFWMMKLSAALRKAGPPQQGLPARDRRGGE